MNEEIKKDSELKVPLEDLRTDIIPPSEAWVLGFDVLSSREQELLHCWIEQELTNKQIANQLHISTKTVEKHKANILKKLGAKNSIGLIKKLAAYANTSAEKKVLFAQQYKTGVER